MRKNYISVAIFVVLFVFVAIQGNAKVKELEIRSVNLSKILSEYNEAKELSEQIKLKTALFEQEKQDATAKLEKLQEEIATVAPEKKPKLVEDFRKQQDEVSKEINKKGEEILFLRQTRATEVLTKIKKIVSDYALKNKITFILNDENLLYASDITDITSEIISILNNLK